MGRFFSFPPATLDTWIELDKPGRRVWLAAARDRRFAGGFVPSKEPGRTVVLEGANIDSRLGFYCAIGEAVNGPGGYFGLSLMAFDDCLFRGFGLEYPYTIVWRDAAISRGALGPAAMLEYLDEEFDLDFHHPDDVEEARAWLLKTRAAAERGELSFFDEIVDAIRTVPERGRGECSLILA